MVSATLVEELRVIIKEDYQVDLQPQEASEIANSLVNFFELLAKIQFEDVLEEQNQIGGDEQNVNNFEGQRD